jgi:uncharacterized protein YecT (DUF1311 family)
MNKSWIWITGLWIGAIAALPLASGQAQTIDCQDPQGTPEYNYCAQDHYKAVDATLNQVYQAWKNRLSPTAQDKLTDAALAWIDYRDAHCAFEVREALGGTGYPAYLNECLARLTEARTAELEHQTNLIP